MTLDSLVCQCGNTPDAAGIFPCLDDGTRVEPTVTGTWGGRLYVCGRCGVIIDQGENDEIATYRT